MTLSILIWNAQHFDNQSGKPSEAYEAKKSFLDLCLTRDAVDILVLMETGKTGNQNERLIKDLSGSFTLLAAASQEDGIKKDTTLGTLVFVSNARAGEFGKADGYVLGDKEQRSAVIIRHVKFEYGMAFYHANSSYLAMKNALDTVSYINSNLETLGLKTLGFFGGDLNVDAQYSATQVTPIASGPLDPQNPYSRIGNRESPPLSKLTPSGSGYTHANFEPRYEVSRRSKVLESRAKTLQKFGKKLDHTLVFTLVSYTPVLRSLDYAYVDNLGKWSATCDASFSAPTSLGRAPVKPHRISRGIKMRSDHYPVLYIYTGDFS